MAHEDWRSCNPYFRSSIIFHTLSIMELFTTPPLPLNHHATSNDIFYAGVHTGFLVWWGKPRYCESREGGGWGFSPSASHVQCIILAVEVTTTLGCGFCPPFLYHIHIMFILTYLLTKSLGREGEHDAWRGYLPPHCYAWRVTQEWWLLSHCMPLVHYQHFIWSK